MDLELLQLQLVRKVIDYRRLLHMEALKLV